MKNKKKTFLLLLFSCALGLSSYAADTGFSSGDWKMTLKEDSKKMDIAYNGETILSGTYAQVKYNKASGTDEVTLNSYDCTSAEITRADVTTENWGNGKQYTVTYTFTGSATLVQSFYFYDDYPYFLVRVTVKDSEAVSSNNLVPLMSQTSSTFLTKDNSNRILCVPYDNDGFSRYAARKFGNGTTYTSPTVSAIYSGQSRKGLVLGAVEHDTWKSAVSVHALESGAVNYLKCRSGYTSKDITSDVLPHGKVTGTEVNSALFMVGYYDDWRKGMDAFAHACTLVAPPAPWTGGDPFGWSSWGAMQTHINYQGCLDVFDFLSQDVFKEAGFFDEKGEITLTLDAWYSDNISKVNLQNLSSYCGKNKGVVGAYAGFLCRWDWENREASVSTNFKVKDILLKVNGEEFKHPKNGALCVDPTHPGTIAAMKTAIRDYAKLGFKYIKIDFMDCGICEGDSYYVEGITTGVQAYNYFMKEMYEYIEQKIPGCYTVLAMSPMFPYQYTTGRRTTCDSWGSIWHSQYVLNGTSYGWWTDKLYASNDPDHLVMIGANYDSNQNITSAEEHSEGVNRIRLTSGAITGAYIVGDNFSDNCKDGNGTVVGNPALSRERALKLLTNSDINEMARTCGAFYPVNGHEGLGDGGSYSDVGAEKLFMYENSQYVYVALFAYAGAQSLAIQFDRIGVASDNVSEVKELWEGKSVTATTTGFTASVPKEDVRVYRITKKDGVDAINDVKAEEGLLTFARVGDKVNISSKVEIDSVAMYALSGSLLSAQDVSAYEVEVDIAPYTSGLNIVKVVLTNGMTVSKKL